MVVAGKLQTCTCKIRYGRRHQRRNKPLPRGPHRTAKDGLQRADAQVATASARGRAGTGIAGLDDTLAGGLPQYRVYVIEGDPGAGKTTLALQFLREGVRLGERVLYVTLSETAEELHEVAESHGWSLDGIDLLELDALAERLQEEANYTVYHPVDVELGETTKRVRAEVERLKPSRVALDSVSELKILSQTSARYRREILGLKQFFAGKQCTVLVLDDRTMSDGEQQLQSIAHGVIRMKRETREYGDTRRQLHIVKMRGVRFRDGMHDFVIRTGGIELYPRLRVPESGSGLQDETITSGVRGIDDLLGGGLDRGTSTLVMGPAGCGKTTLCSQYMMAALNRGETVCSFLFEESCEGFLQRARGMGMDFEPHLAAERLELRQIDPAELSPGEFASRVGEFVERRQARIIVIDSLNGYLNAMPSEKFLLIQMHELLMYLGKRGVVTLLVMAQHGLMGSAMSAPVDVSFLADTVILLRYFEAMGEVRQAISVVKKRRSGHERTIRELRLGANGVSIGEPLRDFHGVLTGVPTYRGAEGPLISTHLRKEDPA
jgi:circadian clock protein KaiC